MVKNLHLRHNKQGYLAHRTLEDNATKIVPIVIIGPTHWSNHAYSRAFIVPIVPWNYRAYRALQQLQHCVAFLTCDWVFFFFCPRHACQIQITIMYKNVDPWEAMKVPRIMQKNGRNTSIYQNRKEEGFKNRHGCTSHVSNCKWFFVLRDVLKLNHDNENFCSIF